MLDWISNFASDLDVTLKSVFTVVATIVFIVLSHKGGWAVARVIISAVVAAGLIAVVWNMNLFAKRVETDIKNSSPSVVVVPDGPGPIGGLLASRVQV